MEKREPSNTASGNQTGTATVENSMEVPQRTKNITITRPSNSFFFLRPSNSTPGYLSEKKNKNTNLKRYMHPDITQQQS